MSDSNKSETGAEGAVGGARKAAMVEAAEAASPAKAAAPVKRRRKVPGTPKARRSRTEELIRLLSGKAGRDIAALSARMGWQAHTTRAALSRLRAAGHELVSETAEGRPRRYRIVARQAGVPADVPADHPTATATGETI